MKLIALLLLTLATSHFAFGQERLYSGAWTDSKGVHIYTFSENNDFLYQYTSPPCVKKKTKGAGCETWYRTPVSRDGAWKAAPGVCWKGKKKTARKGDIMIYVGTVQCCLAAQLLGKNLVLSGIWGGAKLNKEMNFCGNRVLQRVKKEAKP